MNRCYQILILATAITLALPLGALADQYDPPSVESYVQGHAKIVAAVSAGPSGAPAGFRMQWMKLSDFQANGNQWYDAPNEFMSEAVFMGEPTLNTWDGQLTTFCLEPEADAAVEIGDLFDETGLTTSEEAVVELSAETTYIFRACANGDGVADDSEWSETITAVCCHNRNCTNGRGYWWRHPFRWPVCSLTLGNTTYNKLQLLAVLIMPAFGNGMLILAHQLIAVELNIARGADPVDVEEARAAAHALMAGKVVPPIGCGWVHPRDASPIAQIMDDYNNGLIGPGHCPPISTTQSSWAGIKALYR
jgi:hypothetical protein